MPRVQCPAHGIKQIAIPWAERHRLCPRYGGTMCIIALIDQPEVIEKILTYLGLWPHTAHAPPPSMVA